MFDKPDNQYDVIVVGAGPSGLTTATALARAGASVLVLEKHSGLSVFPKATGLRPRTMEMFRSWGLDASIVARSQPTRLSMSVSPILAVSGNEVSLGLPTEDEIRAVSPSQIAVCPQDRVEQILLTHLLERGGEVRFSAQLTDVLADDSGVRVVVNAAGGQQVLYARYLVGADGAHSRVRDEAGIVNENLGSEGDHLGVLFRGDLSSVVPAVPHALHLVVAPGLEGMFVPTGEPNRWIYDIEWHPDAGDAHLNGANELMAERIRAAAGLPRLEIEIIGMFPWDFGASVARRQRSGRVFLVGDAAHRTTPRGATGMNTGIADGHNLGWKLAWVVRGWAGESLLDTYEPERAPVGRANAQASLQTATGAPTTSALAHDFGVDYASGAVIGSGALAGRRAPHAWVTVEDRAVSSLDLFDGRFTVLTGASGDGWREVCTELAMTGMPIAALGVGREIGDSTGALASALGLRSDGCVLVRPDGYVAWSADNGAAPGDLRLAVLALTGRTDAEPASDPVAAMVC